MSGIRGFVALVLSVTLLGCSNIQVGFDTFPDGSPVPSWTGGSISPFLVSTQYSANGVARISSDVNGVLPLAENSAPSLPNVACPRNTAGSYVADTNIELAQSTCNVWVTITGPSAVTMLAFDTSGSLLGSAGPARGRLRINACGIRKVRLTSTGNYCFDDFTWQKRWP